MTGAILITGMKEAQRAVSKVSKQTPFATMKAINATAADLQKYAIKKILPDNLTIRAKGKPWHVARQKYGFNISPFAKKDRLEAHVGSRAPWLQLQETGGTKRAKGSLAIPTEAIKKKEEIVKRNLKPAKLLARIGSLGGLTAKGNKRKSQIRIAGKKYFPIMANGRPLIEMPSGAKGIWARDASGKVRSLFKFEKSARIRPVLKFRAKSQTYINKVWKKHFSKAMDDALKTAK